MKNKKEREFLNEISDSDSDSINIDSDSNFKQEGITQNFFLGLFKSSKC